jgi:N-acetylglutamate synthase-like GNAT family acetyltransferase
MKNRITIRKAHTDDLPEMAELLAELFKLETDFPVNRDRQLRGLADLLQADKSAVWVAEDDGKLVGMVSLQILISTAEGGSVGLLEDLVVTEAYRGQGVGRRLLASVELWARENRLSRLQLLADQSNAAALEFYRSLNWSGTRMIALRKFP